MFSPALQLGLLLHSAHFIRDDEARSDLTPVLDAAQQAEALGYDHVWVGDSSRMERGWPRADWVGLVGALAMKTARAKIGVIPLSGPLRNPVLLAHQLATLDVLAGGRLLVSIGIGKGGQEGEREFANVNVPFHERGARLTEMLTIMKRLWTEPSVSHAGRFYQLDDATVFPKPVQRPIPLYVATGRAEAALRRAGRYGDGWFTTVCEAEPFVKDRKKVAVALRDAGRKPTDLACIGLYATFHLERDGDKARAEAPGHMRAYFGTHRGTTSDFFGSPDEIAQRLQVFVDAGLTTIVARIVEQDLPKQTALLREMAARLTPSAPRSARG
jgi:alkanesulfonate monooxygenase SsuD/methylene tetrahydromethanopterin reductase-like flavin-dependent oxidoreductase (luciferase family)